MKKRFGITTIAIMLAWFALMPVAEAQAPVTETVMKGTGRGDARALDLDILGLVRLTLGAADGKFELNTKDNSSTSSGRAVAICNLISGGSDPLNCTGTDVAASAAPAGPAQDDACTVPALPLPIASVELACAHSKSAAPGARPTGTHEASVAGVKVGLPVNLQNTLDPVTGDQQLVDSVVGQVATLLSTTPAAPVGSTVQQLTDQVRGQLNQLLAGVTTLATIKVLPAQVEVTSPEDKKATVTATSSVVSIDLLNGLILLEVTPSLAAATYTGATEKANCHAEAAVVRVKVKNLLGGGNLVDVAPGLNLNLSQLLPGGLVDGLVGVKVATATPDSMGDTCRAEARGLELSLLSLLNGGIQLRVASVNAEIAGDVETLTVAGAVDIPKNLPTTGGPTQMYIAMGLLLGTASLGAFQLSRKVRQRA